MPNREDHNLLNKLILGRTYDKVNRAIDLPSKYLGREHRRFFHDDITSLILFAKDPGLGAASVLHRALDRSPNLKKIVAFLRIAGKR